LKKKTLYSSVNILFSIKSILIKNRNWERGMKENVEEANSCMLYLIHFKNLCKCCNVPPPITTIKEKRFNYDLKNKPTVNEHFIYQKMECQ
jgi:hypothetical protein